MIEVILSAKVTLFVSGKEHHRVASSGLEVLEYRCDMLCIVEVGEIV